jgi:hypothetical protein
VAPARRSDPAADDAEALRRFGWYVAEFGLGEDLAESTSLSSRRLVLVPVGRLDRRAVKPVEQAWRIPASERRALHVVTDEVAANDLADEWLGRGWSFPLWFVEDDGGIAATIARVILIELAGGFEEVVVLVGRLGLRRPLDRMSHHRTADAIGRRVQRIPAVQVGLLTVATA